MKKAFTLIELLVVVALIAIVSTLAVSKIGNLKKNASRKVSIANQQAVSRAVDQFMSEKGGRLPDRLDALMDMDTPLGAGEGFKFAASTEEDKVGYLYWGPDDAAGVASVKEVNAGLTPNLRAVLVPYSLSRPEAMGLSNFGMKYTMRHTTYSSSSPRTEYGSLGADGAYLSDDAAIGLDPERSACVCTAITNGLVVAAVNPKTAEGREIYRDMGLMLLATEEKESGYTDEGVKAEVAAVGGPLIAFGLGQESTIVGAMDGGLESAPFAEYPLPKFYRRYILLFQMRSVSNRKEAVFAGVLDPCGMTIRKARTVVE